MHHYWLLNILLLTIVFLNRHVASGQSRVTNNNNNSNESVVKDTNNINNNRNAKSINAPYKDLLSCAVSLDGHCFLDESENLLYFHYRKLWGKFYFIFTIHET